VRTRDTLIDAAIRLHIDGPLLRLRGVVSPRHRGYLEEQREFARLVGSWISPTSNCIDIGAYNGRTLAEIVRLAPGGRHIAYEPLPHKCRLLERRFPGVDVRQAAVSDHPGQTTFTIVHDAPALSGLRDRWRDDDGSHRTELLPVRVEALDSDLPPDYVPHFIKIDVEGAERLVFEGAVRTIRTHKPTILFEHGKGGAEHYDTAPADVYGLLTRECGLQVYEPDRDRPLSLAEFQDVFERNERWDFVARA
jgi:FkbM family methyltransferase